MSGPAPLVPADVDLRDFAFMPLDVVRLRDSDLAASASAEEFRCAVLLWCASWHQVPAASLPDDDAVLSSLAGFGRATKEWLKHKQGALRGWIKCSDGRLYHPVVAEKAIEASEKRATAKRKGKAGANKRWGPAIAQAPPEDSSAIAQASGLPMPADSKGQGQGQIEASLRSAPGEPTKDDWPDDWLECVLGNLRAHPISRGSGGLDPGPLLELRRGGIRWASVLAGVASAAAKAENPIKSTRSLTTWITNAERDARRAREAANSLPPRANGAAGPAILPADETRWRSRFGELRAGSPWHSQWGPKFDKPDCLAPVELVDQHKAWCKARERGVAA